MALTVSITASDFNTNAKRKVGRQDINRFNRAHPDDAPLPQSTDAEIASSFAEVHQTRLRRGMAKRIQREQANLPDKLFARLIALDATSKTAIREALEVEEAATAGRA